MCVVPPSPRRRRRARATRWPAALQAPPSPPATELSFLFISDWGGQEDWPLTTQAQTQCASAMATVAYNQNSQFVLSGGDNFYEEARSTRRARAGPSRIARARHQKSANAR